MRIFVTGASGWIGSATVSELIGAGHQVVGLARSDESAERIEAAGATAYRGDLDDPEGLAKAVNEADGVIHLAFQHEIAFSGNFAAAAAADRGAVEAMGAALADSDRPFVLASGMLGLNIGRVATENDGLVPTAEVRSNPAGRRAATALLTLSFAGIGVRSSVLRFPPTVHGDGDKGFVATFVNIARQSGVSAYVGDGANRWPAVHRYDAARLARLAVETAPAGSVLHAVGDQGVEFREIAEAIGRQLDVPTRSIAPADAPEHFAHLGHFVGLDSPATATITCELLGWEPTGPTLIEDLDQGHYFRNVVMRDDVRRALAIDGSSTIEDRTVDITTTGRRSGEERRIEIAFYRLGDDIYLSGIPGPKTRNWLANLAAQPHFTFHLKHGAVADLPATATVIVDPTERRRVLAVFVEQFNHRRGPDSPWPEAVLDEWVAHSPLAKVTFEQSD